MVLLIDQSHGIPRGGITRVLVDGLGGGQFHRLIGYDELALQITVGDHADGTDKPDQGGQTDGLGEQVDLGLLLGIGLDSGHGLVLVPHVHPQQAESTAAHNHEGPCADSGEEDVGELNPQLRIGYDITKTAQPHMAGGLVDLKSDRVLHEAVGSQNPDGRHGGTQEGQPDEDRMHGRLEPVPGEHPHADES